ncbi:MAG: minichromosome maintenance protein MCM [Candidatus Micrarchaeota archaeon]|nr:minichromosome maintenance protein MCM [Candidatus Micrarchaeota archaeon]MDE1847802.1 minichromosome maintenance protein MCM [Candidatus Micrarchaeota archaeon]MDE1864240.1 minichromosome maintenance protein MCM [Candidatus Micrarchaeota archaeon]
MDAIANEELKSKFVEFFNAYYLPQINSMFISYPKKRSVTVDLRDLEKFDSDLTADLIGKPDDFLHVANAALASMNPNTEAREPVYSRFMGLDNEGLLIQDVGSQQIGKLLVLDSLVVKRAEITPKVYLGVYRCSFCGSVVKIRIESDNVPDICPQCKRRSLRQSNEESEFINLQRIAVQDPLERLKGSTPTWQLEVWLADDLVNTIIPGDRVEITGILRIRPRKTSRGKEDKTLFTMFFDSVSIKPKQKEFAEIDITREEEEQIREMARDPKIFEKVAMSIAPSIYGHEEIKQSLAIQLFGGTPEKKLIDGSPIRSDIHMLLIGDPGSAKTRLLQAVSSIVPKGIYVSGKSTSSAGLTASAERDEFAEGGWTLKAGALVLGSGGTVCIDEFDKIGDEDKSSLLEALESQTISVAKAGIVARFNARTSVLAAANPKFGRFDPNTYPAEQFDIPPALLSRFDLIFPIKDVIDLEQDKKIAKHILIQHEAAGAKLADVKEYEQVEAPPIASDILRKYIAYAKKNVRPRLSNDATTRIEAYYVDLRTLGLKSGATPITPRQIEGLIRIAEGSAKSRLSAIIELKDAELAIGLFEFMLRTLAVDRGGRRDIDTIITGMPREKVTKINSIITIIKKLEQEEGYAKMTRVLDDAEKEGIDRGTTTKYINDLERSGDIYSPKQGIIKLVKRDEE